MTAGFKEWGLVCDAMGMGRQSILLRKGGIAEEEGNFVFRHREFYLIPSHFHEQAGKLKSVEAMPPSDELSIDYWARVLETRVLTDWETVRRLDPFHVWKEEVIRERFERETPQAIHLAILRVYSLNYSWVLPANTEFSGCKSWFDLPDSPAHNMSPVLDDAAHEALMLALHSVLEGKA